MRQLTTRSEVIVCATVIALLSSLFLLETTWFARRHSLTYDETIYLNLSLQSVRNRHLEPEFMRLGVAPLAPFLTYAAPIAVTAPDEPRRASSQAGRVEDAQLIRGPRFLNALLIGVPVVLLVFAWLYRRQGLGAAALGGLLTALSPTLVAHGGLATTDESLALFSTLALAAIAWSATAPNGWRLIVCALAIAAAMSAKYSAIYLLVVAPVVFLLAAVSRTSKPVDTFNATRLVGKNALQYACLMFLILPLWWAGHGFVRVTPQQLADPDQPRVAQSVAQSRTGLRGILLSLAPVGGIQRQIVHSREGDEAFLLGKKSKSGWRYYFPLMFLFKSTPAELALTMFLLVLIATSVRHPWRALTTADASMQTLLVAAGVFGTLLLVSHLDLGHRYMIPVYPMLFIAGCDRLADRLRSRPAVFGAIAAVLIVSQAWSSWSIAPHYLSYVNRFAGGPQNGWRLMADSSLDWGQDLPDLSVYLATHDHGPVAMKYFGTALPEAYGVKADDIEHLHKPPNEYALFVVSATYLNGLHLGGRDPFVAFRRLQPTAQVGNSIMVYDLTQSDALFALREALKVIH